MQDAPIDSEVGGGVGPRFSRLSLVVASVAGLLVVSLAVVIFWPDGVQDGNNAEWDDGPGRADVGFEPDLTVEVLPPTADQVGALLDELRSIDGVADAAYLEPAVVRGIVPDGETLTLDAAVQVAFDDGDAAEALEDQLTKVISRHASLPG